MATIHLVIGPVGAGKSTFALGLCAQHKAVRFNLDEWMSQLFSPDRPETDVMPWYVERTERCIEQIWTQTERIMDVGGDVLLEIGLIRADARQRLYDRVDTCGYALTMYVIDAPRELRKARVARRNQQQGETFSMLVPDAIFELASDMWQPPDADECEGRDVRWVHT